MQLVVDNRERHVIEQLQVLKVPHQVATLDIGDFQIKDNDTIVAIWERKTYSDLAASVSDKRYAEQKHRLLATSATYKGYILEGYAPNPGTKFHGLHPGTIDSICLGLTCRDGLMLVHSNGTGHTAVILQKMLKKFPEYVTAAAAAAGNEHQSALVQSTVSSVKSENYTPETCYLSMLSQLPQVSYNTARAIKDHWPTLVSLVSSVATDRSATVQQLSDVKVTDRRIGASIAGKIIDFLVPLPKKVNIAKRTAF